VTRRIAVGGLIALAGSALVWWNGMIRHSESGEGTVVLARTKASGGMTAREREPNLQLSQMVTRQNRQQSDRLDQLVESFAGWEAEELSERATAQLRRLAQQLTAPGQVPRRSLAGVVAAEFGCTALRPQPLTEVARRQQLRVLRAERRPDRPLEFRGEDGLNAALTEITSALAGPTEGRRVSLKVVGVELRPDVLQTQVRLEGAGRADAAAHQITSHWLCDWTLSDRSSPRLTAIRVLDYEEVILENGRPDWLVDRSPVVMPPADSPAELQPGMDYWVHRLDRRLMVSRFGHHGLAVADVNLDGRDDLYLCQPGGLPNRLLLQQADGTVRDATAAAGLDILDSTSSALFADLDNDGDPDLVLATIAALVVLANQGDGTFQPRTAMRECDRAFSLTVVDYDQDGRLDIYACRYRPDAKYDFELPLPVPYQDANNGGRNLMYRNGGNFQFQDVTRDVGLDENNTRFSFAAAWEDYDNDGDPDLYVANDYGRNCLYQNHQGQFHDLAAAAQVEDVASGMSVSWSDYNHDGWMDLYVGNMFSSAGNRIAFQRAFAAQHDERSRAELQRHARGNTLFQNRLGGAATGPTAFAPFADVSEPQGVTHGRWAWGCLFADMDNDSWDDLLVVNGLMTTDDPGDL
jgi:hypothetical protein